MLAKLSRSLCVALVSMTLADFAFAQTIVSDDVNQASFQAPAPAGAASAIPLIPGDNYTLRVVRHGVGDRFKGELVKENARWIVLRTVSAAHKQEKAASLWSVITGIGHKHKNEVIGPTEEILWIPRDAAAVENHTRAAQRMPQPPVGEIPPEHAGCSIQLVRGGKPLTRQGGIETVNAAGITMSIPKKVKLPNNIPTTPSALLTADMKLNRTQTRYNRESLAQQDILCIRIVTFDATAVQSER